MPHKTKVFFVSLFFLKFSLAAVIENPEGHSPLKPLPGFTKIEDSPGLDLWEIIPTKAGFSHKIEIFDLNGTVTPHLHKVASQTITVMIGALEVLIQTEEGVKNTIALRESSSFNLPPGVIHGLKSIGGWVRYLSFSSPAFDYPQDVYDPLGYPLTE